MGLVARVTRTSQRVRFDKSRPCPEAERGTCTKEPGGEFDFWFVEFDDLSELIDFADERGLLFVSAASGLTGWYDPQPDFVIEISDERPE